ncbi:failed axon connections-like [Musca autumnalis]
MSAAEVSNNPAVENKLEDGAAQTENENASEKTENVVDTGNAQDDNAEKQDAAVEDTKKESETATVTAKAEPAPKCNVHKTNFEKDMIYLYQFSRTPLLPSLSPYCLKVETWLRLAGLKYENVDHKMRFRSKKGQLPFIELNGEEIADSAIIIKDLSSKYGKDLDAGLTTEQRNVSYAMIAMLENHLIWIIFYWRAKFPDNVL